MSRMSATAAPSQAPPPRARNTPRRKKPVAMQDRLSTHALFWRKLRRLARPVFWGLVAIAVLAVMGGVLQSVPMPSTTSVGTPDVAGVAAEFGLRVSNVVINGAQATDMSDLQTAIGVKPGDPLYGVSLGAIKQRVEQLGPVDSATVERVLPGTLVVTVSERKAYAIWQTVSNGQTQFVVVDSAGNTIPGQDAVIAKHREPWLLLLTGAGAPQNAAPLVSALMAQPAIYAHVTAAEWVDGLRWNLILKDQAVVKLPASDLPSALAQLANLQSSMQLLDRPVEAIDMRLADRLVVQPYPAPVSSSSKPEQTK